MKKLIFMLIVLALPLVSQATPLHKLLSNPERAKFDYQMNCQGCHVNDGSGGKSIPNMQGFIGHFMQTTAGREYLVRVPGSANAALSDERLTEVLNWMLLSFSGDSLASGWQPFSMEEVAQLRKNPLLEVEQYRKNLVAKLKVKPVEKGNSNDE